MQQAKLSSKFQLSIPKVIREEMQLRAGQNFILIPRGNIIELIPMQPVEDARGMLSSIKYKGTEEYRDRKEREY